MRRCVTETATLRCFETKLSILQIAVLMFSSVAYDHHQILRSLFGTDNNRGAEDRNEKKLLAVRDRLQVLSLHAWFSILHAAPRNHSHGMQDSFSASG
jgi:hypothetical protein